MGRTCNLGDASAWGVKARGGSAPNNSAAVAARIYTGERLVPIEELDDWAQLAFQGYKTLNRIQSRWGLCSRAPHCTPCRSYQAHLHACEVHAWLFFFPP